MKVEIVRQMMLATRTKYICQLYLPAFFRSYGKRALRTITALLPYLKMFGFSGIYLIALWQDGGYDNGFDIVEYRVNHKFGSQRDLAKLIRKAHQLGLIVGVDVVPNHVSDQHFLVQDALNGVEGYEDTIYTVTKEQAEELTRAGVPSFFGKLAYSELRPGVWARTTFADYHQVNLNWNSPKVQDYFRMVFDRLRKSGVDFVRIDCGMMLLEDVSKADPTNPMACMNPKASVEAIRAVAGDMPLMFEWFDMGSVDIFHDLPWCWAIDNQFVMTGEVDTDWDDAKAIPLLGGHDQMTLVDRGLDPIEFLMATVNSYYAIIDLQTILGWQTLHPGVLPSDAEYDADLKNPNRRYLARRPIAPVIQTFINVA